MPDPRVQRRGAAAASRPSRRRPPKPSGRPRPRARHDRAHRAAERRGHSRGRSSSTTRTIGKAQRRARVAQRVVGRRVQPPERGREQADAPTRRGCPRRRRASSCRKRPVCSSAAAIDVAERQERHRRRHDEERDPAQARIEPRRAARRAPNRRRPLAGHRRQLRRRDRHAEQADRQRVQQLRVRQARSPRRSAAGSRCSASTYALDLHDASAEEHRHEVRGRPAGREPTPRSSASREIRRDAQDRRAAAPRTAARCRPPIPTRAARPGAAAASTAPNDHERRDHRGVPHHRRRIRQQEAAGGCSGRRGTRPTAPAARRPETGCGRARSVSSRLLAGEARRDRRAMSSGVASDADQPRAPQTISASSAPTAPATRSASRRSPRDSSAAYTGMNDADSAPSPNRFWRRFGMRNAALNASAASDWRPK